MHWLHAAVTEVSFQVSLLYQKRVASSLFSDPFQVRSVTDDSFGVGRPKEEDIRAEMHAS